MKTLLVYYSRTGTTKKVAEEITVKLNCDVEELIDTENRNGALGYMRAGRDALKKKITKLEPIKTNVSDYKLIIIGTPIWAGTLSVAIRTYLEENRDKLPRLALFCTKSGEGNPRIYSEVESTYGHKPIAKMTLLTKEVAKDEHTEKLLAFLNEIE